MPRTPRPVVSPGVHSPTTIPLATWLEPARALPLIEIALDVTIRTPVIVSSPACAVVRGLIGQRLRDLRRLTGASTCSGCPVAAACDCGRIFEGGSPHLFWLQGIPATTELDPGAQLAARLYLAAPAHTVAQYLDVTLRDALRALDPDAVLSASRVGRRGALPGAHLSVQRNPIIAEIFYRTA